MFRFALTASVLLIGMASMILFLLGINWMYGDVYGVLPMLNPIVSFPLATSMLILTCVGGMLLDKMEESL